MISAFLFLSACGDQSQELGERVTQLQKELDRAQRDAEAARKDLQATQDELARLKTNAPSPGPEKVKSPPTTSTPPSRAALEASYMESAKALKKQLEELMKDLTLGSVTLHNIQLPDSQFPVTSSISVSFQSSDGKPYRIDFPVKADLQGNWVFPEPAEISRRVNEAIKTVTSTSPSASPVNRQTQTRSNEQPTSNVQTRMPSDTTVVIQWPNSSASPSAREPSQSPSKPTSSAPPNAPQSTPGPNPKKSIPADRDVLIRF